MKPAASGIQEQEGLEDFLAAPGPESFAPVFEAMYARLMRYFLMHRVDRASAEELTQDVLMAVYRGVSALRSHELFIGWVFRIARNAFVKHVQKLRRNVETVPLDSEALPHCCAMEADPSADLQQWFSYLHGKDREILTLRYVEELSYQQIAEALDLPIGTVKWRLYHAKEGLACMIENASRERTT